MPGVVVITASETRATLGGTVRDGSALPVAGVAVRISSATGVRTAWTDAAGHYRFADLAPRAYSVRLAKPSSTTYAAIPKSARATIAGSDDLGVDLVVLPK